MIHSQSSRFLAILGRIAVPAIFAILIAFGGASCASSGGRGPTGAAMYASSSPVSLGEFLIEGNAANGDDIVLIRGQSIGLGGDEHQGLIEIADAAALYGDFATQYGAIALATAIAPRESQRDAWNRYAALFGSLPACGAAALSEALPQDIEQSEARGAGLAAFSSIAYSSLGERAALELGRAESMYQSAHGWFDDDESMIERARVLAFAAHAMNRTNPDSSLTHRAEEALASTRGDLYEHQLDRADRVFKCDRDQWRSSIEWARSRAATTLELYESGRLPARPEDPRTRAAW
jgi:hypothetical protein